MAKGDSNPNAQLGMMGSMPQSQWPAPAQENWGGKNNYPPNQQGDFTKYDAVGGGTTNVPQGSLGSTGGIGPSQNFANSSMQGGMGAGGMQSGGYNPQKQQAMQRALGGMKGGLFGRLGNQGGGIWENPYGQQQGVIGDAQTLSGKYGGPGNRGGIGPTFNPYGGGGYGGGFWNRPQQNYNPQPTDMVNNGWGKMIPRAQADAFRKGGGIA